MLSHGRVAASVAKRGRVVCTDMLYPVQTAQPGFLSVRVWAKAHRIALVPTGTDRMDLGGHPAANSAFERSPFAACSTPAGPGQFLVRFCDPDFVRARWLDRRKKPISTGQRRAKLVE